MECGYYNHCIPKSIGENMLKQNNGNKISNTRAYFDVLIAIAFAQVNYGCHKLYP